MTNPPDTSVTERVAIKRAEEWLRECSTWLMTTDLDMTCPMQADPLDIADDLAAISSMPALEEENGIRAALQGIVDSWDRNTHQQERFVADSPLGAYWSPAAAMVDSKFIAAARAARTSTREGLTGGEEG